MKQEDKELLLKYLCMVLPYEIYVNLPSHHLVSHKYAIYDINIISGWTTGLLDCAGRIQIYGAKVEDIKPYLRSMSSMTEEEEKEICQYMKDYNLLPGANKAAIFCGKIVNWLLKNHFDFMDLIPQNLAIKVTKDNNPYASN